MKRSDFEAVLQKAAQERGCTIFELKFDDDENVFEVTIDKADGIVDLQDCEYVHRAVLDAFDRNVEDYALTISSRGMDPDEADEMLKHMDDQQ